jgi:carboxypeptidase Taq
LQDIHWVHGWFGYFPSYTLGNIYAAQMYEAAKTANPGLEEDFAEGNFKPLLDWQREHVHRHGRRYQPAELVQLATGAAPDSKYLFNHLKQKIKDIY